MSAPMEWARSTERRSIVYPPKRCFLGRHHDYEGSRLTIEGGTGEGKSMVGLGRAYAQASGQAFLNQIEGNAGPVVVLYTDYEMGRQELQERLKHFAHPNLYVICFDDPELGDEGLLPLDTPKGQKQLRTFLEATGAQSLFIDNLASAVESSFMGGSASNGSGAWESLAPFFRDQSKAKMALTLLCHTNNTGDLYGDKRLTWQMTARIKVTRYKTEGLVVKVEERKIRGAAGCAAAFDAAFLDGGWSFTNASMTGCVADTEKPKRARRAPAPNGAGGTMTPEQKNAAIAAFQATNSKATVEQAIMALGMSWTAEACKRWRARQ